jgi:hypothetical protein
MTEPNAHADVSGVSPGAKRRPGARPPAAPPPCRPAVRCDPPPTRGGAHGGRAGQERAKSGGGLQLSEATARVTKLATKVLLIAAAIGAAQMGVALLPTLLLPHWFSADPAVQVAAAPALPRYP